MNSKDVQEGVADAIYSFIEDHPLSLPIDFFFEKAIHNAVTDWMNAHKDEIIRALGDSE